MPGSYPDPRAYAESALLVLEEAYEKSHDTHLGSLILSAIESLNSLQEELCRAAGPPPDPYEFDELNSAV